MKSKYRSAPDEPFSSSDSNRYYDSSSPHQPVKSPSPDKRAANIIVCTKSPELTQHRHLQGKQPNCNCHYHHQQHTREKPFPVRTPTKHHNTSAYKAQDTQPDTHEGKQYISESRMRNPRISIEVESIGEGFEGVSRIRELGRSESSQLDYIKLLKSKEETIKELKEIIEMIKRNGTTSWEQVDQNQKLREMRQKAHDLSLEVKQLKIQNQHLLNAIERNKKNSQNNSPQLRDEILQRQIRQLKQTLRLKEVQLSDLGTAYERKFYNQQEYISRVEGENQSLLRILKEKEESLGNSSLSAKSTDKEKLTLIKIREQYSENLKLMKDNFCGELQQMQNGYSSQIDQLHRRIDSYSTRIGNLENLKPRREKVEERQEFHRQKIRQQQIQNLMLEKYSKYEKELQEHRKNNDRLIQEVLSANKRADDLNRLVGQMEREIARLKQQGQGNVAELLEERKVLLEKNNQLEVDNLAYRRQYEDLGNAKARQIDELQKKIEVLLMDYEHHSKQEKNVYEATISKLRQQLEQAESKRKEIVDYYQKDKIDTEQKVKMAIDIYNRENQTLKLAIGQKNQELQQRSYELERLRDENAQLSHRSVDNSELQRLARQCEQSRKRCQRLEGQIGQLNHELVKLSHLLKERDEHVSKVQVILNASQQQKDTILRRLNESQLHNNDLTVRSSRRQMETVELGKKVQILERDLANNSHNYNLTINQLRQQLASLQHKNSQLGGQLFEKNQELQNQLGLINKLQRDLKQQLSRKGAQGEPIEQQLTELRKVVCECFKKLSVDGEKEIVEEYYRLSYNYELKLQENLKLMKQADDWKHERVEQQRQRELLNEKIELLEHNNAIYERELKERRTLYEQLLQEKSRIQREILMAKKIKVEQSQIDQTHQNTVAEITARIDRLLDLERQRNQQSKNELRGSPSRTH